MFSVYFKVVSFSFCRFIKVRSYIVSFFIIGCRVVVYFYFVLFFIVVGYIVWRLFLLRRVIIIY